MEVTPGGKLSLQKHPLCSEHWVVVADAATLTRGNEITYIPASIKHRIENCEETLLQIIEVQVGNYLEEDDIEHFDDNYDRN